MHYRKERHSHSGVLRFGGQNLYPSLDVLRRESMNRSLLTGCVLLGTFALWIVPRFASPVLGQTKSAPAPHIGEGGLPQFEKDPAWPKLPSKWKMGFGSAVAVDADG